MPMLCRWWCDVHDSLVKVPWEPYKLISSYHLCCVKTQTFNKMTANSFLPVHTNVASVLQCWNKMDLCSSSIIKILHKVLMSVVDFVGMGWDGGQCITVIWDFQTKCLNLIYGVGLVASLHVDLSFRSSALFLAPFNSLCFSLYIFASLRTQSPVLGSSGAYCHPSFLSFLNWCGFGLSFPMFYLLS